MARAAATPLSSIDEAELVGTGEPWTRVHRRIQETPGAVVDVGCATWDWSRRFFGTRRVVGADPFEVDPEVIGVELFPGLVTAVRGEVLVGRAGISSSTRRTTDASRAESITLPDLLERFGVDQVSALKINAEGSEYEILINASEDLLARVDQVAVSFHDFNGLGSRQATRAVIDFLDNWYDAVLIDPRWRWYLFVRRR